MGASGHDDLDQLVTELNLTVAAARQTSADAADTSAIVSWLGAVREAEGSDLLLVAGAPPVVRASGRLLRLSEGVLSSEDVEVAVVAFLTRRLEERYRAGEAVITLVHPQQVHPHLEGTRTGDTIEIAGTPSVRLTGSPEIPGGAGTIAVAVNMIPRLLNAPPGLHCMADLPVPAALLGDARRLAGATRWESRHD